MIEILIRLLVVLFLSYFTVQDTGSRPPDPEPTTHALTHIDSVEAQILESFPVQINLVVSGYQPDGCDFPVQVTQQRDGSTVMVEIYREVPLAVMCPAMLRSYNEIIQLEGSFESDTYTIHVNDYTLEVTV